ncbi:MAG: hypothetical protein HZC22_05440 [Rhodocyclales bacterium]|nr:hypothetical protein [Rhodocyclales bacterium]
MNPEQWQQKRRHARAQSAPSAITVAEIAHRVDVADHVIGGARPAAGAGGPVRAEESAVVARHRKP